MAKQAPTKPLLKQPKEITTEEFDRLMEEGRKLGEQVERDMRPLFDIKPEHMMMIFD